MIQGDQDLTRNPVWGREICCFQAASRGILGPGPPPQPKWHSPTWNHAIGGDGAHGNGRQQGLGKEDGGEQLSWAGSGQPWPCPTQNTHTQQQQMSTMRRACSTPAVPLAHPGQPQEERITPKTFCRQGRYTPMRAL